MTNLSLITPPHVVPRPSFIFETEIEMFLMLHRQQRNYLQGKTVHVINCYFMKLQEYFLCTKKEKKTIQQLLLLCVSLWCTVTRVPRHIHVVLLAQEPPFWRGMSISLSSSGQRKVFLSVKIFRHVYEDLFLCLQTRHSASGFHVRAPAPASAAPHAYVVVVSWTRAENWHGREEIVE